MRFFGLTTARIVAQSFLGGSRTGAYKLLGGLTARGELHRHEHTLGTYFTAGEVALAEADLHDRFALLWYCRMRAEPFSLLSPRQFADVLRELRAIVALEKAPRFVPCVHTGAALRLLRVHRSSWEGRHDELNSALASLQSYVASSAFLPWSHFARHGLLCIVYLIRDERHAAEFARWIARHPLLSFVGDVPIRVTVEVAFTPRFPGSLKDKSP